MERETGLYPWWRMSQWLVSAGDGHRWRPSQRLAGNGTKMQTSVILWCKICPCCANSFLAGTRYQRAQKQRQQQSHPELIYAVHGYRSRRWSASPVDQTQAAGNTISFSRGTHEM